MRFAAFLALAVSSTSALYDAKDAVIHITSDAEFEKTGACRR
jgi:hypothetical protein